MTSHAQTLSQAELIRLPRGRSQFTDLRNSNQIYVDKTELIFELAVRRDQFFLSRPRRFGKTLLISTLESLFLYGIRDFKGLKIEKLWNDTTYDVLRLDFSNFSEFRSAQEFKTELYKWINAFMLDHPVEESASMKADSDPWSRFVSYLTLRPLGSLVVLIDEYDSPLTHCMGDRELFDEVSSILRQFFLILKSQSGAMRFFMVTGISRFQHLGIFSAPNQITDISLTGRFGALLGYTTDEMQKYFSDYIANAACVLGISYDECLSQLKSHYDGFCFDTKAQTHVFSPWSVLNFLIQPEEGFANYWYGTAGTPSILLNYLKDHRLQDPENYGQSICVSADALNAAEELSALDDTAMLFHTGYLTIKGIDEVFGDLILNYPNKEVALSLARLFAEHNLGTDSLRSFTLMLLKDDAQTIIAELNRILTSLDYKDFRLQDEASVRSMLQLILMIAGLNPKIEVHNHKGRSDLEVEADRRYFVFELKYHREGSPAPEALLEEAVSQIVDNHYGEQNSPELTHVRIAMVFSQRERRFTHCRVF